MLEILGTIAGNILSLPGIVGLALGMATRKLWLAAAMGACVGVLETVIFAKFDFSKVEALELMIAISVGILAGATGSAIRKKGASV